METVILPFVSKRMSSMSNMENIPISRSSVRSCSISMPLRFRARTFITPDLKMYTASPFISLRMNLNRRL